MTDLAKLSAAATQGEWGKRRALSTSDGEYDCAVQGVSGYRLECIGEFFGRPSETATEDAEANAAFIVALVNAYRSGELIERRTQAMEELAAMDAPQIEIERLKAQRDGLAAALREITPCFNMARIIMDVQEARDEAGEIVGRARAALSKLEEAP